MHGGYVGILPFFEPQDAGVTESSMLGHMHTHPGWFKSPHDFFSLVPGTHALLELDDPRHDAVSVFEHLAAFDDGDEFLREADFALQAGPDLGDGEDG